MARKVAMTVGEIAVVRTITGAPVPADSATYSDAAFPEATDATTGGAISCLGMGTIWLGVEFDGGTSPTATIELLVRDASADDNERWKTLLVGGVPHRTAALGGTGFQEMRVDGGRIFPRLHAVTGNPTAVRILARPGILTAFGKGGGGGGSAGSTDEALLAALRTATAVEVVTLGSDFTPAVVGRALWVGTGGNVKVDVGSTTAVTLPNVPSGSRLDIAASKIYSTANGTTASDLVVLV